MARGIFNVCRGLTRERLRKAATTILVVRVVEGLAAWVLFNSFFLSSARADGAAAAAFVAYFVFSLLVLLRLRAGRIGDGMVWLDLLNNIVPFVPAVALSGGWTSPLLLILPSKITTYAIAFSTRLACLFGLLAVMTIGAATVGAAAWSVPVLLPTALPPAQLQLLLAAMVIGLCVAWPAAVAALLRSVGGSPGSVGVPLPVTGPRPEPDSATGAVANALLLVSEAVSRLTRLDEILEQVVEVAPRSLSIDYCGIAMWDEETGSYTGAVAAGTGPTIDRRFVGVRVAREEAPDFEWVRRLGHCAVVSAERAGGAANDVPALLIAPLISGKRFFGVIQFARRGAGQTFVQKDFKIADGIARQTAVALDRARLVEDSRRLVRALESTGEAVLITDVRRRVIFANPAFMQTFGYPADQLMGRDALDLAAQDADWARALLDRASGSGWRGETLLHRVDGSTFPAMLDVSLIRSEEGQVQGAVAIIEDISAEKMRQEQMQRADRLAAVGEVAAGLAHEINNALSAVFGQTERSAQARGEEELRAALQRIDGQARRIADIVQGLLGFARPRPPQPAPLDLVALTRQTIELVSHEMERQAVQLETSYDPDLPPALADPQQVQQVLLNLLGNAIQAMTDRETRLLRVGVTTSGNQLAVRVTDSGTGIPAEILPRIFDPFVSSKPEGTGLGLSVSYAIARAHGGDLLVCNEAQGGATFTLVLPTAERAPQEGLQRVLLVDDEPEVAEALTAMLVREGLEVECAGTGAEALEKMRSGRWDGLFLDVRLPDLSGAEVFERLRVEHPEMATRVVFVTGGLWRGEGRLREQLPAQLVLPKPCTQEQVREAVRFLRQQRRQAA